MIDREPESTDERMLLPFSKQFYKGLQKIVEGDPTKCRDLCEAITQFLVAENELKRAAYALGNSRLREVGLTSGQDYKIDELRTELEYELEKLLEETN
jgi:hypothetical protein